MPERVSIREAARRLGVSDTAVHKAIKAGRITPPEYTDNGRAFFPDYEQMRVEYSTNTSDSKRSHVGSRGGMHRANDSQTQLQVSARMGEPVAGAPAADSDQPAPKGGPTYAQSRAVREAYQARLVKLEYEQKSGKLVSVDDVKVEWFKHIAAAKTRIMGIPAACKSRYADLPLAAIAIIEQVCREALEDLANDGSE